LAFCRYFWPEGRQPKYFIKVFWGPKLTGKLSVRLTAGNQMKFSHYFNGLKSYASLRQGPTAVLWLGQIFYN